MPLTVACLFVQGEYPYTTEYVWRLYDMVLRWAGRDFRFVILTDQPDHVDFQEFHTVGIQKLPGLAYWSKLELFNPARDWTGRVLYLDLDTAIVGPLDPIIDVPHRFAITSDPPDPDRPRTHDRFGRLIVRRFNSSVMVWNAGAHPELYTDWTPAVAERLSGDQDWIAEQLPGAATLPRGWFPRISECATLAPSAAKVVLVKHPKNHLAVDHPRWPWLRQYWGPCACGA
jgi:hypothetical protein